MGINFYVRGLSTFAVGIALVMSSQALSSADSDVVGKTYGEAKGLLGKDGMSTVVATVVGDRAKSQDDCYVVSMTKLTPLDSSGNAAAYKQVQVNLNCYAGQSDKKAPGYSKGNLSPDAVAVRETNVDTAKTWRASAEGQKWCAKFEGQHPEWVPIPYCHSEEEEKALKAEADKRWKASPEGQVWCAKFEGEHPEWAPIADCHPDDESAT